MFANHLQNFMNNEDYECKLDVRYCEHIDIDNAAQNAKFDLFTSKSLGPIVCWIDVLSCFAVRNALRLWKPKTTRL